MNTPFRSLLLIAILLLPLQAWAQKSDLTKSISEKYDVSPQDKVTLINKFGDITINTWNRNEVSVEVTIEAWGKNEKDAQEMLDKVRIAYGKTGTEIKFQTELSESSVNINDKSGFRINYVVNMPTQNSLMVQNKYGAVNIADFGGLLDMEVSYGQLQAGNLSGKVKVVLKYSKGSIDAVNTGELEFRYSGNVNIGKIGTVALSDKYGGLTVEEADAITADIAYSGLKLGKLNKSLELVSKYSGCNVKSVSAGFEKVEVDNAYGAVNLGFAPGANFQFDVETKFGGFKSDLSNMDMQKQVEQNNSAEYEGKRGGGGGRVSVKSSFGSVKFVQ